MTTTTNYGFNLPAGTDPASITPLNQNTEMMDRYLKANINAIAEDYDESVTYNTGDLSVHDNGLYVCNDDGVTGTWDSTKWDETTVGENLGGGGSIDIDVVGEESGSIVTFNDGSGLPLKSLTVEINAVQTGSGTPSPENVRPISGWDSGEIVNKSRNLVADKNGYVMSIETNDDIAITAFSVRVQADKTYTVSCYQDNNIPTSVRNTLQVAVNGMNLYEEDAVRNNYHQEAGIHKITFTANSDQICYARFWGHTLSTQSTYSQWQIEESPDFTMYQPYWTPITYTLDFPQTIYGGEVDIDGELTVTHGEIASYNGETINEPWISSLDEYVPNTSPTIGAQVVYPLTTPTTTTITPVTIETLEGTNNIFADCGDISLEYIKGGDFTEAVTAICEVLKKNDILTEYELYDYIQSDGTQVIDTGHQLEASDTVNILYAPISDGMNYGTAWGFVWSAVTSNNSASGLLLIDNTTKRIYDKDSVISTASWSNGQIYQESYTVSNSMDANVKLLGVTAGGTTKAKIFDFSINGNHYLPAKRKSDGVFGLYDVANEIFLTDVAGGNAFTAGSPTGIEV